MPIKTIQIAVLGGNDDAVLVGLRNFPAHKLILFTTAEYANQADSVSNKLANAFKLEVEVAVVKDSGITSTLQALSQVVCQESGDSDFLINIGSAGRNLACAGVTSAFVLGIRAFDVLGDQVTLLPVMRLSYAQAVTEPKLEILRAIERSGGDVESLEKLSVLSGYGKPLLSYHIRGSQDGEGLEKLGLVEIERGKRGRLRVKLTELGRTVLSTIPVRKLA